VAGVPEGALTPQSTAVIGGVWGSIKGLILSSVAGVRKGVQCSKGSGTLVDHHMAAAQPPPISAQSASCAMYAIGWRLTVCVWCRCTALQVEAEASIISAQSATSYAIAGLRLTVPCGAYH
jgi:hypothetical protein